MRAFVSRAIHWARRWTDYLEFRIKRARSRRKMRNRDRQIYPLW